MSADDPNQRAVQDFLREADLALATADLATTRDDREAVAQAIAVGRRAWDDLTRRKQDLSLTAEQEALLQSRLDRLRARLRFLGLTV